jgi:small-conductance mechanosensitive channel
MVRSLVEAQDLTRFERAHFKGLGASSLDFEAVYWVLTPEYGIYMDRQQAVNLGLLRAFESEGIDFASASQTLLLTRPRERPSKTSG